MISPPYPILIRDQQLWLSTERCIYWEQTKTLILCDTHFGKTGHFRKEGIGLPQGIYHDDLKRFVSIVQHFQPEKIIIIGDLFHSYHNKEIDQFEKLRKEIIRIPLLLIRGNHDILNDKVYKELDIQIQGASLNMKPFVFTHDLEMLSDFGDAYCFSGHLHPGIKIKTKAKQTVQLPCFYFNEQFSYLPAFSLFTGTHIIKKSKHDTVFMITKKELIQV